MSSDGGYTTEDVINGIHFPVKYVGSIPVEASMKSLAFDVRTSIAKECIRRVCETGNFIPRRKRSIPEAELSRITSLIGEGRPSLRWSGEDVTLIVSGDALSVVGEGRPSSDPHFSHAMPSISFASGGDEETPEFVCYVGKNPGGRECHVFESGLTNAPALLEAIGLAFKYRYEVSAQPQASPTPAHAPPPSSSSVIAAVRREPWFHGKLSREATESLLQKDGEFLVRESCQSPGELVLSGQQGGLPRHLLLIDSDGKVRTRDREFSDVSHLIAFHRDNNLPITSQESALLLKYPILHNASIHF